MSNLIVNNKQILEIIEPIIQLIAKELSLIVLEATFTKEGSRFFLRIFIYKQEGPVNINDCSTMSRMLSAELDKGDLISVPYNLEVSSPGTNKKLKKPIEYQIFKGMPVKIVFKKAQTAEDKVVFGNLIGLSDDNTSILIEKDNNNHCFSFENIKVVQLDDRNI